MNVELAESASRTEDLAERTQDDKELEEMDKAIAEQPLMPAVRFSALFWLALYSNSHPPPLI